MFRMVSTQLQLQPRRDWSFAMQRAHRGKPPGFKVRHSPERGNIFHRPQSWPRSMSNEVRDVSLILRRMQMLMFIRVRNLKGSRQKCRNLMKIIFTFPEQRLVDNTRIWKRITRYIAVIFHVLETRNSTEKLLLPAKPEERSRTHLSPAMSINRKTPAILRKTSRGACFDSRGNSSPDDSLWHLRALSQEIFCSMHSNAYWLKGQLASQSNYDYVPTIALWKALSLQNCLSGEVRERVPRVYH